MIKHLLAAGVNHPSESADQSLPNSALALGKIIELIGLVSGFDEG